MTYSYAFAMWVGLTCHPINKHLGGCRKIEPLPPSWQGLGTGSKLPTIASNPQEQSRTIIVQAIFEDSRCYNGTRGKRGIFQLTTGLVSESDRGAQSKRIIRDGGCYTQICPLQNLKKVSAPYFCRKVASKAIKSHFAGFRGKSWN